MDLTQSPSYAAVVAPAPKRPDAEKGRRIALEDSEAGRGRGLVVLAGAALVVLAGALAFRFFAREDGAEAALSASASASAAPAAPPRCATRGAPTGLVVGEPPRPKPAVSAEPSADPQLDLGLEPDRDDLLAPFAVVMGRAVSQESSFYIGVLGDGEGGTVASVVVVDAEGGGSTIKLARSRADFDPPVLAAAPTGPVVVALTEPSASGRAIRLAALAGGKVTWGAEIPEGRDESLALDVALGEKGDTGLLAWDDAADGGAFVIVASFKGGEVGTVAGSRRASPKGLDCDSPRVAARPDGFWLAYLVHGHETDRASARGPDEPAPPATSAEPAKKKKPKAGDKPQGSDDVDESQGGESVATTWIEVVALDAAGNQASEAMRVSKEGSSVLSFDVGAAPDGALVVAYRDDDSPSGGGTRGPLSLVRVSPGGVEPAVTWAELPSDGVPSLLPGWLVLPTLSGPDILAKLDPKGMPAEEPLVEPSLERGEPIAARGDTLLLAEPLGKAMRLRLGQCGGRAAAPAPAPASSED